MASWKKVIVSGSNLSQLNNDAGYLTSATVGNFVSGSSDSARTNLNSVTADELSQILNINTTTISTTQWGYLGGQDQSVAQADSVTFAGVTAPLTGDVTGDVTGTADTASYVAGGNVDGDIAGNAATATALASGQNFSITGDGTATAVSFDGTGAVALSLSLDDDSVDSAEIADGAVDAVHFGTTAKTAISGAFTSDSSSLASRIATLEGSDFVYDLNVSDGGAGNGTITDAETLTFGGGTNIGTTFNNGTSTLDISLDADINLTSVTASIKGDVDGTAGNASDLHSAGITSGEASQIANINSVTISNTQWGYLGAADQGITSTSSPSFNNLTVTGDLTVEGSRTELQVANLNVEDPLILLNSGSTGGADVGIIFGGSGDAANAGHAIGWDDSAGNFIFAEDVSAGDTDFEGGGGAILSKIGEIQVTNGANPTAASLQGVGAINVRTDDETIWIYS